MYRGGLRSCWGLPRSLAAAFASSSAGQSSPRSAAPSGRDLSAAHQGDCRSGRAARRSGATRPGSSAAASGSHPRVKPGHRGVHDATGGQMSRRRSLASLSDRRHGDDRGALGDAPLPATCPDRRLDRPRGLRDGHARGEGDRTARTSTRSRTTTSSPGSTRRASGIRSSSPAHRGRRHRPCDRDRHARRLPGDRLLGEPEHDGRRDRADDAPAMSAPRPSPDGYGSPSSTTVCRVRRACRSRSTGVRPDSRPGRSTRSTSTSTSATSR